MKTRKGITPVIAIVLLLMITVGVVGLVYTQVQNIMGNPGDELDQQQRVRDTDMSFSSVYDEGGSVQVTVRNTGDVTWNTSAFEMQFVPGGEGSAVSYSAATGSSTQFSSSGSASCFVDDDSTEVVDPDETYTCNTGISFPSATQTLGIEVEMRSAEKTWSYSCSPETSSSIGC
jgi:flagellin-like protein